MISIYQCLYAIFSYAVVYSYLFPLSQKRHCTGDVPSYCSGLDWEESCWIRCFVCKYMNSVFVLDGGPAFLLTGIDTLSICSRTCTYVWSSSSSSRTSSQVSHSPRMPSFNVKTPLKANVWLLLMSWNDMTVVWPH